MLPLRVIIIVILAILVQYTKESGAKLVLVSKEEYIITDGQLDKNNLQDEVPCCSTGACTCHSLLHALANLTDNVLINITTDVVLSSIVPVVGVENVVIQGYNNPTVYCNNTGGVKFITSSNITIDGIVWNGCGFSNTTNINPGLGMHNTFYITINNCTFLNSMSKAVELFNVMNNVTLKECAFINNHYGVAIHYSLQNNTQVSLIIDNCSFRDNGRGNSVVYVNGYKSKEPIVMRNSIFVNNQGVSVFVNSQSIHFCGFTIFEGNLNKGNGIFSARNSYVTFSRSSVAIFHNNRTNYGGAIYSENSNISFEDNSTVTFAENTATRGGAIYSNGDCSILFKDNSTVTFAENTATRGGAIYSYGNYSILFKDNSSVTFVKNNATRGGAIYSFENSKILFTVTSTAIFTENSATRDGGAIYSHDKSTISFEDSSTVTFIKNGATRDGGSIHCDFCSILLLDNSTVYLSSNNATRDGGAICATHNTIIKFKGHARVRFADNRASRDGGAISSYISTVLHDDYCNVTFTRNIALRDGGGFYSFWNSFILCTGYSTVTFINNRATSGGALYSDINTGVLYEENTTVKFVSNFGKKQGGAVYTNRNQNFTHEGNSAATYVSNYALFGGAIYSDEGCDLVVGGTSRVSFIRNIAVSGGAIYSGILANSMSLFNGIINSTNINFYANLSFEENSAITFNGNAARYGGAIFMLQSNMRVGENVVVRFNNNTARANGGALYLSDHTNTVLSNDSDVTFSLNAAGGYGGAAFIRIVESKITFSANFHTRFNNNSAIVSGDSLYITVPKSCNRSCFHDSIVGIKNLFHSKQFGKSIAVTPNELELYYPAVCIDNSTKEQCEIYYVGNTMLGQELSMDACPLDYYGQQSNGVQFTVSGEDDDDYYIDGENDMLISCGDDTFQGISIAGNETLRGQSSNYSITVQLNVGPYSDEKIFSIEVVVEISPCHPGFFHDKELQKCMCYNDTDIVFCSGSSSTIKRGYWFGSVNKQPTVAVCPVNYCDFSCCETTNSLYHLFPQRANQCRAHRSGIACGNCEEDWTLSFDSAECIPIDKCTVGKTALIVTLTVLYWISVVVAVFVMMYFKVPIRYLYAISYYYSLLDVWLNQTIYLSQSLLTTFNMISSIFKVTPQFLGQLCLVQGMNGLDQQFIHYVHPFVITLILIVIHMAAKISSKFSSFVSRGIVHVICLLLLLSYTSIATTSLLLMRALTFIDINKAYTYLSPDVEYFHGRHLPYAIVAMLFTIVIVIGLPLLLLLEPFLNRCIDFIRIKPLLDQFQGCYKDKFRSFAAYYMICRLVIIMIVTAGSSTTSLVAYYILIGTSVIIAIIHFVVRPYRQQLLNNFDGMMLMLTLLVANLPLFDTLSSDVTVVIVFVLVITPLPMFLTMILLSCKGKIKQGIKLCTTNHKENNSANSTDSEVAPISEFGLVIDDNMRKNAYICDISQSDDTFDSVLYRESFREAMNNTVD